MADPSLWADPNGPVEEAFTIYLGARAITNGPSTGKVDGRGLAEIEAFLASVGADQQLDPQQKMQLTDDMMRIRERVRHTIFAALCEWERQLTYANVNERISSASAPELTGCWLREPRRCWTNSTPSTGGYGRRPRIQQCRSPRTWRRRSRPAGGS
jgi:hypothetical protein